MSKSQKLRTLVSKRLTAAAEEIFALVERTIAEYEEELCRSKEETQRKQQLLDEVLGPRVLAPQGPVPGAEDDTGVQEEELVIKDEPEEHSIDEQQCQTNAEFSYTAVTVKDDMEEPAALHQELTGVGDGNPTGDWTEPWEPHADAISPQQSDAEHNTEQQGDSPNVIHISDNSATPENPTSLPKINKMNSPGCSDFEDKIRMAELMSKVRRHRCPICGKTLKRDLWSHMLVHTGERPFSCTVCQKGFTRKSSLSLHMKLHLSEKPFRCTICQKEFAQKSNFNFHMDRHAKAEMKLQQMQRKRNRKRIKNVSIVNQEHSLVLESEEQEPVQDSVQDVEPEITTPQGRRKRSCREVYEGARSIYLSAQNIGLGDRSQECPICGKRFHDLWPHMRLHTGERPFRCSVCRKGFPRRSSLTLHKRLHMQEKPFKCPVCEKGFTQNNNFKRHMAKHAKEGELLQPGPSHEGEMSVSGVYLPQYYQMENDHIFKPQANSSAQ